MGTLIAESQGRLLTKSVGIRRIQVEKLFGQYTYDLSDAALPQNAATKLLLLYGDNGSGKTTILRLLFYLLSHIDRQGHKTAVSQVRFRRFVVDFANGVSVIAQRYDRDDGGYELRITQAGEVLAKRSYGTEEKGLEELADMDTKDMIRYQEEVSTRNTEHEKALRLLKELNKASIYLTDNRRVLTTVSGEIGRTSGRQMSVVMRAARKGTEEDPQRSGLNTAVDQISSWATRRALRGSAQGEEDVNTAYAAIMKRLASTMPANKSSIQETIDALQQQDRRSHDFVRFGLTKPLKSDEIIKYLRAADAPARETMLGILEPYITGTKARLDALEPIRVQLSAFVDTMNSFYRNKKVHLDVDRGLKITAANGDTLTHSMLSSGEGQLLYLLASTLVAKEQANLFMIDEPELSLNVKWQRQLVEALLNLTADSDIQFVMATHSIELLTRYREFVHDLIELPR